MAITQSDRRIRIARRALDAGGALLVCGILAAASLLIDGIIASQMDRTQAARGALQRFLKTGPALQREHRVLAQREVDLEQRMAAARAKIPEQAGESEFLAQLTNLALQSGLSIRDYTPGPATRLAEHHMVEVEVSAEGDHAGLCQFLNGLPELSRLCRLTELDIETPKSGESRYPIQLKMQIFFQPPSRGDA